MAVESAMVGEEEQITSEVYNASFTGYSWKIFHLMLKQVH
jgi:hypothetical protein